MTPAQAEALATGKQEQQTQTLLWTDAILNTESIRPHPWLSTALQSLPADDKQ